MRTIYDTCQPRKSILQGTFNPEVFTAALSPVIHFYRNGEAAIDSVYTDAETFFTEVNKGGRLKSPATSESIVISVSRAT